MKILILVLVACVTAGPLSGQKKTSTIELADGIILNAVAEPFNIKQHKYDTCDTGLDWETICLIDGKIWFGTDMGLGLPRNQLTKLSIRIKGKDIELDVSGMYNPSFTGELDKGQFRIVSTGEEYTLYGFFSDGAGAYTAHWTIIRGKSLRQIITRDEREFHWQSVEDGD